MDADEKKVESEQEKKPDVVDVDGKPPVSHEGEKKDIPTFSLGKRTRSKTQAVTKVVVRWIQVVLKFQIHELFFSVGKKHLLVKLDNKELPKAGIVEHMHSFSQL